MPATVHPTSIVDPAAVVGEQVSIGPYCTIGPRVVLEDRVSLVSHVVIDGCTHIGAGTQVFPFSTLGLAPQSVSYKGEETRLHIGRDNLIREHVTINPGTAGGQGLTKVGDGCFIMVGAHIAHDCLIGDQVVMANNATLAGHVEIGDYAILGGLCAVHQFVRIGSFAFIGGMAGVERDVIPFGMVVSERGHLSGLNVVGLKRRGFSRDEIHRLRAAYRLLFVEDGDWANRMATVADRYGADSAIQQVLEFIGSDSRRKILVPKRGDGG